MQAPLDASEFERWRAEAGRAAEAAEGAQASGHFEWACFLSEQAAQLALKSILHTAGLDAWGHDLASLGRRVSEALGGAWPEDLAEPVARLSRHYIPTRYPDAYPAGTPAEHYTAADAAEAANDAHRLLDAVDAAWHELQGPS